jgi:hypothetical protein
MNLPAPPCRKHMAGRMAASIIRRAMKSGARGYVGIKKFPRRLRSDGPPTLRDRDMGGRIFLLDFPSRYREFKGMEKLKKTRTKA